MVTLMCMFCFSGLVGFVRRKREVSQRFVYNVKKSGKGKSCMRDEDYMKIALEMARGTLGQTSPNPVVGAVVVNQGAIVGMGAHLKAGEPHAEVHALKMAGERARGGTIYVTLEPCSHHGRTPPCTEAVLAAGVSRVVVATLDPNPQVAGRGVKRLRDAGLDVTVGILEEEARQLNEIFFHYITTGRPFVTVKTASTLDGKVATESGHSRWISGPEAREEVHRLRQQYDAILVGVNTVISDDPALTVRTTPHPRHPVRVILDTTLRIPETAQVVTDGIAPTIIFTTSLAPAEKVERLLGKGIEVVQLEGSTIEIPAVLKQLGQRNITSLLVEGGAAVNGAFLAARAIQKIVSYVSLKVVGGASAPTPFGGIGVREMGQAVLLDRFQVERIGERDIRIVGYPLFDRKGEE